MNKKNMFFYIHGLRVVLGISMFFGYPNKISAYNASSIVTGISSCATYTQEAMTKTIKDEIQKNTDEIRKKQQAIQYVMLMKKRYDTCKTTTKKTSAGTNSSRSPSNVTGTTGGAIGRGLFSIMNPSAVSALIQTRYDVIFLRTKLYADSFQRILTEMIQRGLLTQDDRKTMQGKVQLVYVNNCDRMEGKISVKERYNTKGQFLYNELLAITLQVNLCFEEYFAQSIRQNIDHLIVHELGHFYATFHDKNVASFARICWENQDENRYALLDKLPLVNICEKSQFVTTYAGGNSDEDYAESFAFWYLNKFPQQTKNTALLQKKQYFDSIKK